MRIHADPNQRVAGISAAQRVVDVMPLHRFFTMGNPKKMWVTCQNPYSGTVANV
jgi:hypothetical protein